MNQFMNRPALPAQSQSAPASTLDVARGDELRASALALLVQADLRCKIDGVRRLADRWKQGAVTLDPLAQLHAPENVPGRPAAPALVPPRQVRSRSMASVEGRAVMIHALAHIEFNAVNLALDAIWRFAGMPDAYYADWLQVADEEALHFTLLDQHLQQAGFAYGDFPAHDSLWDMAEKTVGDIVARMALVPRTLEARGLDASPAVRAKLAQAGDHAAAAILDLILRDEIGHVAIGNRWFAWLCQQQGRNPVHAYRELARLHRAPQPRGPFNLDARRAAGFSEEELAALQQASLKPLAETGQ